MKLKRVLVTVLLIGGGASSFAVDTYDPSTNLLTIPLVNVGSVSYSNVVVTVGSVVSVGSPPQANLSTYNLLDLWVKTLNTAETRNFSLTGVLSGTSVSGNGTVTTGYPKSVLFEGKQVLSQTTIASGSISAKGVTVPYGTTVQTFFDANYGFVGSLGSKYKVATSSSLPTNAAKINDTGILAQTIDYPTAAKSYTTGTTTFSWVINYETDSTAILSIIEIERDTSGKTLYTDITKYRVTTKGDETRMEESYLDTASSLLVKY